MVDGAPGQRSNSDHLAVETEVMAQKATLVAQNFGQALANRTEANQR
jgi:hypothetical protein